MSKEELKDTCCEYCSKLHNDQGDFIKVTRRKGKKIICVYQDVKEKKSFVKFFFFVMKVYLYETKMQKIQIVESKSRIAFLKLRLQIRSCGMNSIMPK
jgi:hypothetical protein